MLEKLGLRDIPRWYREKYGIPSLLPGGHHNSRGHANHHGQHLKDDTSDRRAFKAIQYPGRSGAHGTADTAATTGEVGKGLKQSPPTTTYASAQQQPALAMPGQRSPHGTANFLKTHHPSHKQMAKHVPGQHNAPTKKIDLLSFDPLPDYPSLDPIGGNLSESPYSTTTAEDTDRAHREDLVRSLQSLVPASVSGNPDFLPSSFDSTGSNTRNRKQQQQQRSRRLYQPRSQIMIPETDQNAVDIGSFKNRHSSVATLSSPASAISKGSTQMTSPLAGPVLGSNDVHSDPPTRVASPSLHSQTSSSSGSMKKLPSIFPRPIGSKAKPGAIGTRKANRQRSTDRLTDDLITLGIGRGK